MMWVQLEWSFVSGGKLFILRGCGFISQSGGFKSKALYSGHSKAHSCEYVSAEADNEAQIRI